MQLRNTFGVPAAPDEAFAALLDMQRVAPCMPGAQLTSSEGDTHQGHLKLRIGPITAAYQGTVTMEDADESTRTARLKAVGTEVGGQGAATACVTASVHAADRGAGSAVVVVTDLDIRGKAAQFGRGALGEVTQRVLDQFARNLEATFTTGSPGPDRSDAAHQDGGDQGARRPSGTGTSVTAPAAELDVLATIVQPMARTAGPALIALVVGVLLGRISRRRQTPAWTTTPWGPPPWWPPPGGGPADPHPPTRSEDDRA